MDRGSRSPGPPLFVNPYWRHHGSVAQCSGMEMNSGGPSVQKSPTYQSHDWNGSFYELSMDFVPCGDSSRVVTALRRLWTHPRLTGPWPNRDMVDSPPSLTPQLIPIPAVDLLYGHLMVDDSKRLGCLSAVVRIEGERDWLDISIPVGMLEATYPDRYPLVQRVRSRALWHRRGGENATEKHEQEGVPPARVIFYEYPTLRNVVVAINHMNH